jgi:hypothetical protein
MARIRDASLWRGTTVAKMLEKQEYTGDVVNFKTYGLSYKTRKRRFTPAKERAVFEGVHEPIVNREDFAAAQARRAVSRRDKASAKRNIFSGLVQSSECGANLHFHFNQTNPEITYFNCPNNNASYKTCSSTHYARADFLEQVVLADIQRIVSLAAIDEKALAKRLMEQAEAEGEAAEAMRTASLARLRERDAAIDRHAAKVYVDSAEGRITDERMAKLMEGFEAEQREVTAQIERLEREAEEAVKKTASVEDFLRLVSQYTRIKRLTKALVNRFIDHIVIHQAKRSQGKWTQSIDIYYNFVGIVDVPGTPKAPLPEVSMKVRKGVVLDYAPTPTLVPA